MNRSDQVRMSRVGAAPPPTPPVGGYMAPNVGWTGTAGTGWTAVGGAPQDPTRLTAKPWCLPLFPSKMGYVITDDGKLVFDVGALDGIASFEGAIEGGAWVAAGPAETVTFTDVNGVAQKLIGRALQPDFAALMAANANGRANMYVRATANDGTMQQRVMGPFPLLPRTTRYTQTKTIGASGKDYTTISAACLYARANPTERIKFTFTDNGATYPMWGVNGLAFDYLNAPWWTDFTTAPGVTVNIGDGTAAYTTFNFDGMHFIGSGIKIDMCKLGWALSPLNLAAGAQRLWLDGVEVYFGAGDPSHNVSGSGAALLINGNQPQSNWITGPNFQTDWGVYYTECNFHDLPAYGINNIQLRRNTTVDTCSGSDGENILGIHGGWSNNVGGYTTGLMTATGALTFTYSGAGSVEYGTTASNGNPGFFNIWIAGASSPTYQLALASGGPVTPSTTIADLVAWINTLTNFSATQDTHTNELNATYLTMPGLPPSSNIPRRTAAGGTATILKVVDIHADVLVWHGGGSGPPPIVATFENLVVGFFENRSAITPAFLSVNGGDTVMKDVGIHNVSNQDITSTVGLGTQPGYGGAEYSHVVVQYASNTNPSGLALKGTFDAYCAYDHCAGFFGFGSGVTPPIANLKLRSLFCQQASVVNGGDANSKAQNIATSAMYTTPAGTPPNYAPLSPLQLTDGTWAGRYLPSGAEQIAA